MTTISILIFFSVVIGISGQIMLKKGLLEIGKINILEIKEIFFNIFKILTNKYVFSGLLLSGIAALFWISILSQSKLSISYPLCAGLLYIGLIFASKIFLQETINAFQFFGIFFIFIGILMLAKSS